MEDLDQGSPDDNDEKDALLTCKQHSQLHTNTYTDTCIMMYGVYLNFGM